MRLRIRGGNGLGDALYVQAIARHLVKQGVQLEVCTRYPEVFEHLNVKTASFSRENIHFLAHYTSRKTQKGTNQWQDVCAAIGNRASGAELTIDWEVRNEPLVKIISSHRPVMVVHGGRAPMQRKDGFGNELIPNKHVFASILNKLRERYFTVYIGRDQRLFNLDVDLDMSNRTSITDVLDIASVADAFFGQCSFIIPLAESFDRRLLILWSSAGVRSTNTAINTITPDKVLSKPTSHYVIDTDPDIDIAIHQFLESARSGTEIHGEDGRDCREWAVGPYEHAGVC